MLPFSQIWNMLRRRVVTPPYNCWGKTMTAQKLWEQFSQRDQIAADYEGWAYGEDPDTLAQLTLDGTKTATASAYPLYELDGEELPKAGEYSVILDSQGEAVCIIQTERVFTVTFDQVDQRQAWKEGEGDRSLFYWRQVHERFFRQELSAAGMDFSDQMLVVCEEFRRVYP